MFPSFRIGFTPVFTFYIECARVVTAPWSASPLLQRFPAPLCTYSSATPHSPHPPSATIFACSPRNSTPLRGRTLLLLLRKLISWKGPLYYKRCINFHFAENFHFPKIRNNNRSLLPLCKVRHWVESLFPLTTDVLHRNREKSKCTMGMEKKGVG
jgi:hypothetical protein